MISKIKLSAIVVALSVFALACGDKKVENKEEAKKPEVAAETTPTTAPATETATETCEGCDHHAVAPVAEAPVVAPVEGSEDIVIAAEDLEADLKADSAYHYSDHQRRTEILKELAALKGTMAAKCEARAKVESAEAAKHLCEGPRSAEVTKILENMEKLRPAHVDNSYSASFGRLITSLKNWITGKPAWNPTKKAEKAVSPEETASVAK